MAVLPIRIFGDPVLREKCPEVTLAGADLDGLVGDLLDSLPRPGGAGLAANQIGMVKRVFVYEDGEEMQVCLNPRIVSASDETEVEEEGCLSVPGILLPVPRHLSIEVEFSDLSGETRRMRVEGWLARVFQHEIDHLDGLLILDRTDRASRIDALELLQGGISLPREPHGGRGGAL